MTTSPPSFRIASSQDPLTVAARNLNRQRFQLIMACAPDGDDLVPDFCTRLAVRLGVSAGVAEAWAEAAFVLRDYPRLVDYFALGFFTDRHILRVAQDLFAVAPDDRSAVEEKVLCELTPTRPDQHVFSPRTIHNRISKILRETDRNVVPKDEVAAAEPSFNVDCRDPEYTIFTLRVPRMEGIEIDKIVRATAKKYECSQPEAVLRLITDKAEVSVTLNLYHDPASDGAVLGEDHWLNRSAAKTWLQRVTHLSAPGYAECEGYAPTESIKAAVAGRDLHCRFPGCEVPAYKCQYDHVRRYGSGPTSTANLHLLCAKHHNLKTAGSWDVALHPDGHEVWTSHGDGHSVITEAEGPLGRETFAQRNVRKTKALAEYHQAIEEQGGGPSY